MMLEKTLKELLENPAIRDIAPDAISKWDLSKEDFYNWTLLDIKEKKGWKTIGKGLEGLLNVANRGNYYYKLYSKEECANRPEMENTNIVWFPCDDKEADGRPFIFLIPGGGFVNVWNLTEGWPVAKIFNELGYHVFILTYQVCVDATAVKAMGDIARAMEIIRDNKETFRVNPDEYITCGFSAGGYITCLWNTEAGYEKYGIRKPVACFPIYPVTSYRLMDAEEWEEGEDKDEFARSGLGVDMKTACNSCFEIPEHVEGFPMTAVFLTAEDELVDPEHSKKLAEALNKANIPCRLEIGPTGGHGFADGVGMCMEGWPERAIRWFEENDRVFKGGKK